MAFDLKNIFSSLKGSTPLRPKKVLGIDFGSSAVKVVEVEITEDVLALSTYGELQLGPYADASMGFSVSLPAEKQTEALVDILRESGIDAKNGVFALPVRDSFVTVMTLPATEKEDISSRVPVEARKYIPVSINDVTLEWTEISGANQLQREVLLAAIHNESLVQIRSLLESIHMVSQPVEIEIFSTLRALTKENDTSVAVIDVGAQMSKLYVAETGFPHRIHRVRAGGSNVSEALAKQMNISFEDAENKKRNYTASSKDVVDLKKVMESVFDRPFQEFKRVISQYETQSGNTVSRVILTGGGALMYDFTTYASYMLDKEAELANPFGKIAYPAFMEDKLKEIGPIFAPALGAALRVFE